MTKRSTRTAEQRWLTDDDIANVLAALRYWQARTAMLERVRSEHMGDGEFAAYSDDDIDALCERINGGT